MQLWLVAWTTGRSHPLYKLSKKEIFIFKVAPPRHHLQQARVPIEYVYEKMCKKKLKQTVF